jgi:hypothetical protein
MLLKDDFRTRSLSSAVALCLLVSALARAQQPAPAPEQAEDVVRITSELVQTDVSVFDKRGRFVEDLRPEQFELQVNGRPQAVAFFERVRAGSRSEAAQLSAAGTRGLAAEQTAGPRAVAVDVDRRFVRASVLRFQTYVYNAARGAGGVQLQAQVFRGPTPVINTRPFEVPAAADPARMPFWSELSLEQLPPGRYILQLTANDRTTNRTAVERVGFYVE